MNIEDEIISFLHDHIKESDTKSRNIEIIAYYYGFRGSLWPTLEETAKQFKIKNRERIRQIKDDHFRNVVDLTCIPAIKIIGEVIKSKQFWAQKELEEKFIELEVVRDDFSVRGLLNLMEDLGMDNGYCIYSPDLKKATRISINKYEQNFIINESVIKVIKHIYKKAQNLPGRCGISNLNYLKAETKDFDAHLVLLRDLIKYSENAWTKTEGDEFWYLFENKDNTLINYSEKIFSVIESCEVDRLSETYRNALDRRSNKYPYPPKEIISDYLMSSMYFVNNQNTLTFIGETTKLNEIEIDVVEYLKVQKTVKFPEFSSYLATKGHGKSHIIKTIYNSPLITTDKSKGRYHLEFSLVGSLQDSSPNHDYSNDRYNQFILKLRNISVNGTDETVEQKRRREQRILHLWLFENKKQERCAICGNIFSVSALVTAHKKKRAECNEAERLDPYIVMPVCVFGCDYLYGNKYIQIEDGIIKPGLPLIDKGQEQKLFKELVGRKIDDEWLKGQKTYFELV